MKRKWKMIAAALCIALLATACASGSEKNAEADKKEDTQNPSDTKKKKKNKEKEYQRSLDLIDPQAYSNIEGLDLEPGSYISIIGKGDGGQYWNAVKKGVDQAAADLNKKLGYTGKDKIKVVYSGPATSGSVDEQVNILDEELARYPVALGISIVDAKACEVQFDLAAESDIPVVAFDSGSDYQGLMATVATDNSTSARAAADKISAEMEESGELLLFVHDSRSKTAAERENAFMDQIRTQHPEITIADTYRMDQFSDMQKRLADEINTGTYKIESMQNTEGEVAAESITEENIMDYMFEKHPNIKGCYATNGDAAVLAADSIERLKAEDVAMVAYDADNSEIEALKEGKINGLIVQNPFGMGYATVVAAARAALKMGNEAVVNTGYTWVTKDNIDEKEIQKILY